MTAEPNRFQRFYRLALRAYPRVFRDECAEEMLQTLQTREHEARRRRGRFGVIRFLSRETFALLRTGMKFRVDLLRAGSANSGVRRRDSLFQVDQYVQDARYGLRMLLKQPGVACLAVIAFALGIGSTATMFSVSHGLLRDLPYEESHRLVYVTTDRPADNSSDMRLSAHEILEWREQQSTLDGIEAFSEVGLSLSDDAASPEQVNGARVTAGAFSALRVQPTLGRGFRPEEERPGADHVVILGHRLWANRYGSDPEILGATIHVNGVRGTVIGVMPEWFHFPYLSDLWVPLELDPSAAERGQGRRYLTFGRLREGISLDQARTEFAGLVSRSELAYPEVHEGMRSRLIRFKQHIVDTETVVLLNVMVGVVSIVLLVACVNVANLLLARTAARGREIALRSALGANRARVVRQLLIETLGIAGIGGIAGVGLAALGVTLVNNALAREIPFHWMAIEIDAAVLTFVVGLICASSVIAGTVPALRVTAVSVNDVLKDESRSVSGLRLGRTSRALVIGEIALSCGLLTVAGLLVRGTMNLTASDLDVATENLFTARLSPPSNVYPDAADIERLYGDLVTRLREIPGSSAATVTSGLPSAEAAPRTRVQFESVTRTQVDGYAQAGFVIIGPDFFQVLGVQLISGREFTASDDSGARRVAIVNQSFADRHIGGENPLGQRLRIGLPEPNGEWITVVGLAPDLGINRRELVNTEGVYFPHSQSPRRTMYLMLRSEVDAITLTPAVRAAVRELDSHLPIYEVSTLAREISRGTISERTFCALMTAFGCAGLLLATVGLYGVMAFAVRRRTREMGIRLALGALPGSVLWLALRSGVTQLVFGVTLGILIAAGLAPAMGALLFEANPWDWQVYSIVALTLLATGLAASLIPAFRATRLDPLQTLRYE